MSNIVLQKQYFDKVQQCRNRTIFSFLDPESCFYSIKRKKITPKFKGLIICEILKKKPNPLKVVFLKWLMNSSTRRNQAVIDKLLCGISHKITKQSFFYRIKSAARIVLNEDTKRLGKQNKGNFNSIMAKERERESYCKKEEKQDKLKVSERVQSSKISKLDLVKTEGSKVLSQNFNSSIFHRKTSVSKNLLGGEGEKSKKSMNCGSAIPSLLSIIDQKVFKKTINKLQSHQHLERNRTTSLLRLHDGMTESEIQDNYLDKQITDSQISIHQKVKMFLMKLNAQESYESNSTILLVKQISALQIQCLLRGKNTKLKLVAWSRLCICHREQGLQGIQTLEGQLEIINSNIQKDQLVSILADELEFKVKQITDIQEQLLRFTNRMQKSLIRQFVNKIGKIIYKHKRQAILFLKKNSNSVSCSHSEILSEGNSFDSKTITKYCQKFDEEGLLSVKKLMELEDNNTETIKQISSESDDSEQI